MIKHTLLFSIIYIIYFDCSNAKVPFITEPSADTNLTHALSIICSGVPKRSITILLDQELNFINKDTNITHLVKTLHFENVQTVIFYNSSEYFDYLNENLQNKREISSLILSNSEPLEIILQLCEYAHRLMLYIFYWGVNKPPTHLQRYLLEPLRVVIITEPRAGVFRLYYNQATPMGRGALKLVNWYTSGDVSMYRSPLLPPAKEVFNKLQDRIFYVPVLNAPPWHFVKYTNTVSSGLYVTGGRDHTLLELLSQCLKFRYEYLDPPERTQGSAPEGDATNLSYTGGLGMLQRREADLFLGDVTVSWERSRVVDFSFLTLADSGAFVTHSARKLSETLVLLRPFRLEVWPLLAITIILAGPTLFLIITFSNLMRNLTNNQGLFRKCVWFTTTIFLRQGSPEPDRGFRSRFLVILLWFSATYVLGDVYSAQLTSQLARPATEQPIKSLSRLDLAVKEGYQLFVERQSASLAILQNGTGVFARLYSHMLKQPKYLVPSIEVGVKKVEDGNTVIMGGRETLYFNIRKNGALQYQLSEKLYTRYSAVAVQAGSPYVESLNRVLVKIFEAGILDKITSSEYERMFGSNGGTSNELRSTAEENSLSSQNEGRILQPISIRMLQGAFIVLTTGYALSGIVLLIELQSFKNTKKVAKKKKILIGGKFKRIKFKSRKNIITMIKSWLLPNNNQRIHYQNNEYFSPKPDSYLHNFTL